MLGYDSVHGYDGGPDDNFYLSQHSPAIDAGNSWAAPATDMTGHRRSDDPGTQNTGSNDYFEKNLSGNQFTAGGTAKGWHGQSTYWNLTLPFAFAFYDGSYTSVAVSSSGFLQFAGGDYAGSQANSDGSLLNDRRIAPLWANLRTDLPGDDIYVDTSMANQVTVRWQATDASNGSSVNMAVTLFANGNIRFDYGQGNIGTAPTIGLSYGNGISGVFSTYDGLNSLSNLNSVQFSQAAGIVDIGAIEFLGSSSSTTLPSIVGTYPAGVAAATNVPETSVFQVRFNQDVNPIDANAPHEYELRGAGADGVLGTSDDVIFALQPQYSSATYTTTLAVVDQNGAPLTPPPGPYQLPVFSTSTSTVHNLSGLQLASGSYVRQFTITSNVAPVLDGVPGSTSYQQGNGTMLLAPAATLIDPSSPSLNGGNLTVTITAGDTTNDVVQIVNQGKAAGQIGLSGSSVLYGGVSIGSYTGGMGTKPLVVTFNSASSPAAAQALIDDLAFNDLATTSDSAARTLKYVLTDEVSDTTFPVYETVQVMPAVLLAKGMTITSTQGVTWSGVVATFTDAATQDAFSASIQWDDGSTSSGTITGPVNGVFSVHATHTFTKIVKGAAESVTIGNQGGAMAKAQSIANVNPITIVGDSNNDQFVFTAEADGSVDYQVFSGGGATPQSSGVIGAGYTASISGYAGNNTVTVYGTSGNDTFGLSAKKVTINGVTLDASGTNGKIASWQLDGSGGADLFTLSGTVGSMSIDGGSGSVTARFGSNSSTTGVITSGINNTLDYSADAAAITVNLTTGAATGTGGVSNVKTIDLGGGTNSITGDGTTTLVGPNTADTWSITSANAGTVAKTTFSGVANIVGGGATNDFKLQPAGSLTGTITGGAAGGNTLDYSLYGTAVGVDLTKGTATATGGVNGIQTVAAGNGASNVTGDGTTTLIGPAQTNTWNVNTATSGTIVYSTTTITYAGIANLVGGSKNDTFMFGSGVLPAGTVAGGSGANTLNFSKYASTAAISVDLHGTTDTVTSNGTTTVFSGIKTIVGDGNTTNTFTGPSTASTWTLTGSAAGKVAGITFSKFPMLVGWSNDNTLIGPNSTNSWNLIGTNAGSVAGTTFSGMANLTGGSGADTFKFADGAMVTGALNGGSGTGINTVDYSAYTTQVYVNLADRSATGVGGVLTNIANATGGKANNVLVGDSGNNLLTGGLGRNVIIGGGGANTLTAGSGQDLLIAGTTSFDMNDAELALIAAEWFRTDRDFATRLADLAGAGGGGYTGPYLISDLSGTGTPTVFDNAAADTLNGNAGASATDWFFAGAGDIINNSIARDETTDI